MRGRGRRARVVRLVPVEDVVRAESDGRARDQRRHGEADTEQPEHERRVTLEPPRNAI